MVLCKLSPLPVDQLAHSPTLFLILKKSHFFWSVFQGVSMNIIATNEVCHWEIIQEPQYSYHRGLTVIVICSLERSHLGSHTGPQNGWAHVLRKTPLC